MKFEDVNVGDYVQLKPDLPKQGRIYTTSDFRKSQFGNRKLLVTNKNSFNKTLCLSRNNGQSGGLFFEIESVEPWVESPADISNIKIHLNPKALCKCNVMTGCTCGVFENEMTKAGRTYNSVMKFWER